jgi:hypothetical protein
MGLARLSAVKTTKISARFNKLNRAKRVEGKPVKAPALFGFAINKNASSLCKVVLRDK